MARNGAMTLSELCKYMESQEYHAELARKDEQARQQQDKYWKELGDFIEQHPIGLPRKSYR